MLVSAHASAKLMQIGQPVSLGFVDEDRIRVGNVESAFNDRRRQQDVGLAAHELEHAAFEFALPHLPVSDA
jgi:hypothetical protein